MDIGTLLHAAGDHLGGAPAFALKTAIAALGWMAAGQFYELKAGDIWQAMGYVPPAAAAINRVESTRGLIQTLAQDADALAPEQPIHRSRPRRAVITRRYPRREGPISPAGNCGRTLTLPALQHSVVMPNE